MHDMDITVIVATRNEAANIGHCLAALEPARRVIVVDSESSDGTPDMARAAGAEVIAYKYAGGYPRKRQWTLDRIPIDTTWVMVVDADEVVVPALWDEIRQAVATADCAAWLAHKMFHFMGRRFRFGGFSHAAVLLFRRGCARYERLLDDAADGLDMEVHERLIVDGPVGQLRTGLVHEDFKGLGAYIERHHRYAAWEAALRYRFLTVGRYGTDAVQPRLWGNAQERRRFLKRIALRLPGESSLWFLYHYVLRLGFLEGARGLIACRIRRAYIEEVRARVYALRQ